MEEKRELKLKILEAKKETLYLRIQRLYDYTKDISIARNLTSFKSLYNSLDDTRDKLVEIVDQINLINLELKATYVPNFQLLDTIDELYCAIQEAAKTVFAITTQVNNNSTHSAAAAKLPKIELPEFSGDPQKWPVFYETFKSLIHDKLELDNTCRLHYLLGKLNGKGLALCSGIPPVAANYATIWQILVDRYQDKRSLACNYFKQIIEFKYTQSESVNHLNLFLERFDTAVNALKGVGIEDLSDFILFSIAFSKLDHQTQRLFERSSIKSDIPTYQEFVEFVKQEAKILSRTPGGSNKAYSINSPRSVMSTNAKSKTAHSFVSTNPKSRDNVTSQVSCSVCRQPHLVFKCPDFLKLDPRDRYKLTKDKGLCINCLSEKHKIATCKSSNTCATCKTRHHSLLHFHKASVDSSCNTEPSTSKGATSETIDPNQSSLSLCSASPKKDFRTFNTLLATAVIKVKISDSQEQLIRVLLDSASQENILSLKCCRRLQLPVDRVYSSLIGIGIQRNAVKGRVHNILASSRLDSHVKFRFDALVMDQITPKLPSSVIDTTSISYLMDLPLADDRFYQPGEIDGILGAEIFPRLVENAKVSSGPDMPIALRTKLGYVVMGKVPGNSISQITSHSFCLVKDPPLEKLVQKFLELEEIPSVPIKDPLDIECENHFTHTHTRNPQGRYVLELPFKENPDKLGDSYSVALRRFLSLERKLESSLSFREQYNAVVQDYIDQGHMRLESQLDPDSLAYYIPHHAVFKMDSSSTPLRVVFDASAKTDKGLSLNDILHTGPKLHSDVLTMFLNFRLYPIALTADIKQMYRQIDLQEKHRHYQKILWRFSPSEMVRCYELTTLAFGVKSSPFLALRTVHQLATDEEKQYPRASEVVRRDMYVDDLVSSIGSLQEAKLLYHQLVDLFNSGCFHLVKWSTNSKELLNYIPQKKRLGQVVNFEGDCLKILGMQWHPNLDTFSFNINVKESRCSKRHILSIVAGIFDPLGLVSPVTLFAKLFIKKLWSLHLDWDECPPSPLVQQWSKFQRELTLLDELRIPRHLGACEDSSAILIGFADACETSYGAVTYLRTTLSNSNIQTRLICSKTKVSPLKVVSIPRLELCAALLLAKLINYVVNTYQFRYRITQIYACSDSTVTLHWINSSPHRWKTFVANRVAKIHDYIPQEVWFHIKGGKNPADLLSRGMDPSSFVENSNQWLMGPRWLSQNEEMWPITKCDQLDLNSKIIEEKIVSVPVVTPESSQIYQLILRHSSWEKLLRSMVYVLRFIKLLPLNREILASDLASAESALSRVVQDLHFREDIRQLKNGKTCSHPLRKLRPFFEDGLIRVGGRLSHANIVYDHQHPILFPKKDHFVNLLIDYYHRLHLHTGPHLLLSLLRQKYWILSARGIVRQRVQLCNLCFKHNPKPRVPLMADLPSPRVLQQVKAFVETGVDFAGPYNITLTRKRGIKSQKAYICLFVCMTTKALHLELASDLSTATFLDAFKRFLCRRGPIKTIRSDCGTNFIGAKAHLDDIYRFIESSEYTSAFKEELLKHRIDWKLNPPAAPHMGGIWEANIKSVKTHLNKILGSQLLSYEEFATVLTQVESLLNSRPLCWLSSDPIDPQPLTPTHFLTLTPLKMLPTSEVTSETLTRLTRKQLLDHLVQSFWRRWTSEYLHGLQIRQKWNTESCPVKVGTIVILMQDNTPVLQWPIGIIEAVFPGADGVVRVISVKTSRGTYRRPVIKVCPLPTQ